MVRLDCLHGRSPQSGTALDRAPGRFSSFPPNLAEDYSVSGFSQKIRSTLNPSKFVKTIYQVVFHLNGAFELHTWPSAPVGGRLGSCARQIPCLAPQSGERLPDKWVFLKMRSTLNPSKFAISPLSCSLPPEWCVLITYMDDQPNRGPPWVVRQADFRPCAPLWRKTTP